MKKRILSLFSAFIIAFSLFPCAIAQVSADEHHTYSVKYVPEMGEWRVQQSSSWDSSKENGNMDYLWGNLQDGDSLMIIGDEISPAFGDLKIEKKLANLTLSGVTSSIIVYARQNISEIYVLKGTVASLNGSYDTIYVYDNSSCNINNDVKKLQISGETSMKMNVTVFGKVDFCQIDNRGNVLSTMYYVVPGTLKVVDGEIKTDAANYSTNGQSNNPYNDTPQKNNNDPAFNIAPVGSTPPKSAKVSNPLKVKGKTATVKYSKLKKKTQKLSLKKIIKTVKKGQGKITYTKVKGSKKILINSKTGKVTIKKGLKKGTHKIKIKVSAAGNDKYKSASKTVSVKIKVK